ncbi:MAG: ABC transporter substrate-binding protein [Deltaproteobacteria bacterium]|nr:ABC transporter substrate-binding protein [Deltaproteobacteria bacterium]
MRRLFALLLCLGLLAASAPARATDFVDDSGEAVTVTKPYTRVISLYPAHTENLLALGLGPELIGVSPGDEEDGSAGGRPVFSYRDDPERFLAAKPDLVLIRPMIAQGYPQLVARLRQFGVAVVSLQPHNQGELFEYWRRLGRLTGREAEARALAKRFAAESQAIAQQAAHIPPAKRPRVFFEAIHRKMKTFAPDSMAIYVLETAGGVNVAADATAVRGTNIASYGKERILAKGPEIDVYLAQTGPMNQVSVPEILNESGFAAIKAVRNHRVYLVEEALVSRPTPRLLTGMRLIQSFLYPKSAPEQKP